MKVMRFFSLVLACFLVAGLLIVPVFASEASLVPCGTYSLVANNGVLLGTCDEVPSLGSYFVSVSIVLEGTVYQCDSNIIFQPYESLDGAVYGVFQLDASTQILGFMDSTVMIRFFENGSWPNGTTGTVTLYRVVQPAFTESVESGLIEIVGWSSTILDSIISGPLAPLWLLMAVGISVSIVFMVIRVVKSFTWGL